MHIQGIYGSHVGGPAVSAAAGSRTSGTGSGHGAEGVSGVSNVSGIGQAGSVRGTGGVSGAGGAGPRGEGTVQASASVAPLRVDAQRNLEHVLRAAREVFGELGYGAPMEDVARRARVGVGTVYRRFTSKDVLVRRIAEEETARLTEQARTALGQEDEPWSALSRFLRTSVASGAGRLLPPRVLRSDSWDDDKAGQSGQSGQGGQSPEGAPHVPQQRLAEYAGESQPGLRLVDGHSPLQKQGQGQGQAGVARLGQFDGITDDDGATELLAVVGQLVQRARDAGELRTDVTVGDVLLVIATPAPSLPDAAEQAAASKRLLDILLEGLRSRRRI